jgi:SAM-dependent methyltransferase
MLSFFREHNEILQCPRCGGALGVATTTVRCDDCHHVFATDNDIPLLFAPNDWDLTKPDVTEDVQAFYEKTPFPNYDDFDSIGSLVEKAQRGLFAKLLDEQIPFGARVLEVGCGTGQMSNFLSVAKRTVVGADMCLNSLRLGQGFAQRNRLSRVHFTQMNLFRPVFKPETFDVVISNGVLHHTSDPYLAFQSISKLVKPGGHILIGLYHQYGRLITDARRIIFRLSGDRFRFLDPNLRRATSSRAKKTAWFMDQYKHPHESKHTIGESIDWFANNGFDFVKSIPSTHPFKPFSQRERLFEPEKPAGTLGRWVAELKMVLDGSEQGGFFVAIGRRRASASATRREARKRESPASVS